MITLIEANEVELVTIAYCEKHAGCSYRTKTPAWKRSANIGF